MILFEKIRWKNFLSTGNQYIELDFQEKSTVLISGNNGAGKSTVLDALTFVLFSKPYRKINRSQLLNLDLSIDQALLEQKKEFVCRMDW